MDSMCGMQRVVPQYKGGANLYKPNQVEVVVFPLQIKLSMPEAIYIFSEAAPFIFFLITYDYQFHVSRFYHTS